MMISIGFNNTTLLSLNTTRLEFRPAINPIWSFINLYVNTIGYLYLIPIISVFGVFLNILCIALLCSKSLKGDIYKYLMLKTVSELIIVILGAMLPYSNCINCLSFQTLGAQIYRLYGISIINSMAFTVSMLSELAISYDRLIIFKKYSSCLPKIKFKYACVGILTISVGIYVPFLFGSIVARIDNQPDRWQVINTTFGRSSASLYYSLIVSILRTIVLLILFCIVNLLVLVEYRKYKIKRALILAKTTITQKSNFEISKLNKFENDNNSISNVNSVAQKRANANASKSMANSDSENTLTYTILLCCLIYSINKTLIAMAGFFSYLDLIIFNTLTPSTLIITFFCRLISYFIFSSNIFILGLFNKTFKLHIKAIFCSVCGVFSRHRRVTDF
jgi:hypothetical protein